MGETSSRVRKLGPMVAVACVALAVGLVSGRFVRSPEQQAADSAAPPLTPVTDVVQLSVVTHSLAAAATVQPGRTTPVALIERAQGFLGGGAEITPGQAVECGEVQQAVSGNERLHAPGLVLQNHRTHVDCRRTGLGDVQIEETIGGTSCIQRICDGLW